MNRFLVSRKNILPSAVTLLLATACGEEAGVRESSRPPASPAGADASTLPRSVETSCPAVAGVTTTCTAGRCSVLVPADSTAPGSPTIIAELDARDELRADVLAPVLCRLDLPGKPTSPAMLAMDVGVALPDRATLFELRANGGRALSSTAAGATALRAFAATSMTVGATRLTDPWAVELSAPNDPLASNSPAALLRNLTVQGIGAAFYDGTHFFLGSGPRVLVYDGIPATQVEKPKLVLGQPDLDRILPGTSASILASVSGIWSDGSKLAVAAGHRVLLWNAMPTTSFAPADIVLGQQDFTTNAANVGGVSGSTLNAPSGIDSDGTRLLVADTGNHRVLQWDEWPTRIGQSASKVLGQASLSANGIGQFYLATGAQLDGPGAFVSSYYTGTFHFAAVSANTPVDFSPIGVGGSAKADVAALPLGVSKLPGGGLAVLDGIGRIAIQRTISSAPAPMDFVLGQPDRVRAVQNPVSASTLQTQGRMVAGHGVLLASDQNRLLLWDGTPSYTFEPASRVFGQGGTTTNDRNTDFRRVSARTLAWPSDVAVGSAAIAVADRANNRVVLYKRADLSTTNAEAAIVLGQSNSSSFLPNGGSLTPSATTMSGPAAVALDENRLVVADTENHRILVWQPLPASAATPPSFVLGQPDFTAARPNRGRKDADGDGYADADADGVFYPAGVALDGPRLFVADRLNHRVLVWNDVGALANGKAADRVLGQSNLREVRANRGAGAFSPRIDGFNLPTGLTVDGASLWVADTENNRIVRWDDVAATAAPALIVGQPDGDAVVNANYYPEDHPNSGLMIRPPTSSASVLRPRSVAVVGNTLFVSEGDSHRVHLFQRIGGTYAPSGQLGQSSADAAGPNAGGLGSASLHGPLGLSARDGRLFVADAANHRVLGFELASPTNATVVMGQPSFTQNGFDQSAAVTAGGAGLPRGIALDGDELFVAEAGRHRVLVHELPIVPGREPKRVLGQPSLGSMLPNSGASPAASTLASPSGVHADARRLVVADTGNHRVLVYPRGAGEASLVLGQADFTSAAANRGAAATPATMASPSAVFVDGDRLFVADTGNHRVLVWNSFPTTNGRPADVVLGQPSGSSSAPNGGRGVASATSLASPSAVLVVDGSLYVSDTGNNRVVGYQGVPATSGAAAVVILGQKDSSSRLPAADIQDRSHLAGPIALAQDGANLYVADRDTNRIVVFDISSLGTGVLALQLFNANSGLPGTAPSGLAVRNSELFASRLFVADSANDRLVVIGPVSRLR